MVKLPASTLEILGSPEVVYRIPSDSRPGLYHYILFWSGSKGVTCTCEASQYGKTCKHVEHIPVCDALGFVNPEEGRDGTVEYTKVRCHLPRGHRRSGHSWER